MRCIIAMGAGLLAIAACSQPSEHAPPKPAVQFERLSADAPSHGKRVADILGCTGCHGSDLTGQDWSEPGFGTLWTANLTRSVPGYTDVQLAQVITEGRRPDRELWDMPAHLFTHLSEGDMAALIAFLRSRAPTGPVRPEPAFEEKIRREIADGTFASSWARVRNEGKVWPPDAGPDHALGRYIVRGTCAECHGLDLRGGQPHPEASPRPDLRMAAAYDEAQFQRLLRTGIAAGDRELTLMSKVARGRYAHLTDGEIAAVHAYLRTVAESDP